MDTIYRFRPVSRLLDEDGKSGELDGQYIFFPSPEKLNDPLEGYKNVYFEGDRIVWRNLVKHYIRCLINDTAKSIVTGPTDTPDKEVGVFASKSSAPPKINDINDSVVERLNNIPEFFRYMETIGSGRTVSRPELIGHLNLVHPIVLMAISTDLHERGLFSGPVSSLTFMEGIAAQQISKLRFVLKEIEEQTDFAKDIDKTFEQSYFRATELQLINRFKSNSIAGMESLVYMLFEYPENFCKYLDRLIYPDWYVACFMESCSDSSIWGTYGGNHSDVCLKFNVGNATGRPSIPLHWPCGANKQGIVYSLADIPLKKVSYDKKFIDVGFFQSLGRLTIPEINYWYLSEDGSFSVCADAMRKDEQAWRSSYWKSFEEASSIKLKSWDREQEWRIILYSFMNDLSCPSSRKLHYNFESLDGIIFGINTSMDNKLKLIKRVESLCEEHKRESFNFYQATYDSSTHSINYYRLNNLDVGWREV